MEKLGRYELGLVAGEALGSVGASDRSIAPLQPGVALPGTGRGAGFSRAALLGALSPSWASFSPAHESLAEGALFALVFLNWASQKLIAAIYADYARSLKNLGFKQGAILFASKAGAAGRDLLNELESPKQELTAQ